MNKKALKNAGSTLFLIVLFSLILTSLPAQRVMATTEIIAVSPTSGVVGNMVTVNGTIDTQNGAFTIRWNQTLNITSGTAQDVNVTASFFVPQTVGAPLGRNVTIELIDDLTGTTATANFTLFTKLHIQVETPPLPRQLQEGSTPRIAVNVTGGEANTVYAANITVTDPANQTYFSVVSLSNTTLTGYGEAVRTYNSTGFGLGAHTNYTGTYIAAFNETAQQEFFIGLTDKLEYRIGESVQVTATGYKPQEVVTANIITGEASVSNFPKNFSANSGGVVAFSWPVPQNASFGTYNLTLTNATSPGTMKEPGDTQTFEVSGIVCQVQTKNRADMAVVGVGVELYKAADPDSLLSTGQSNTTGWVRFNLASGNYTFKTLWKGVDVGQFNASITQDALLNFTVQLTNIQILVNDASGGLPLIDLRLSYNYTTRAGENKSEVASAITNLLGITEIYNVFENLSYVLEARRYNFTLPETPLYNRTSALPAPWNYVTILVPAYTAFVKVLDSHGDFVSNAVRVEAYEWSSGTSQPIQTLTSVGGNVTFSLTFGKYRLRALAGSTLLNETTLNLIENNFNLTFHLATLNTNILVSVRDYFGQPIPNANVTIERKIGEEYTSAYSQLTGADGATSFDSKVGGDSRLSIYVGGELVAVQTQFLSGRQNVVEFRLMDRAAIFGYPIPTGLFALLFFLLIMTVMVLILARERLVKVFRKKSKKVSQKGF